MKTTLTIRRQATEAEMGPVRQILSHLGSRFIQPLGEWFFGMEPCRVPMPAPIPVRRPYPVAKVLASALAVAIITTTGVAHAARVSDTVDGRLVDVQVLVDGNAAPLYSASGNWDRQYFQAFRGRNYSLSVQNNTGERVGVLIAVDGLNVVNGERSSLSSGEAMYVLGPWEQTVIRGWRTSLRDVRRFVFVDEERSYAERTGQANGDMGWIRVLSFREQRPMVWFDQPRVRDNDRSREEELAPRNGEPSRAPSPNTLGEGRSEGLKQRADSFHGAPESNPGTGWGERSSDPVQRTVFLAAARATDQVILRYEYESGLRALGIFPKRNRTWERDHGQLGFAKPPGW